MAARYRFPTLPDYLRPGLDLVFVGINPGLYSVARGHYFARPTSRFGLTSRAFEEWAPRLTAWLRRCRPRVAFLHGLSAYRPLARRTLRSLVFQVARHDRLYGTSHFLSN